MLITESQLRILIREALEDDEEQFGVVIKSDVEHEMKRRRLIQKSFDGNKLSKKEVSVTPEDIHELADELGVPWDNDSDFMEFCEKLVGKGHLDDMTTNELGDVAGALRSETGYDNYVGIG